MNLLPLNKTVSAQTWSLPAGPSCAGFSLVPGSTCIGCYAAQGRYVFPSVRDAQRRRMLWFHNAPVDEVVAALTKSLRPDAWVRIHASGDFAKPRDARIWALVAKARPDVRIWIATRAWVRPRFLRALRALQDLPNVTVRLSIDEATGPAPAGWPTSGVVTEGTGCPKQTAGSCESAGCRACWDSDVPHVNYRQHGTPKVSTRLWKEQFDV